MTGLESKNHYELLGVAREASADEIKTAYREIARVYHPDSNFYDEIVADDVNTQAIDAFKQITAAYNVLIDPEKRAKYDALLPRGLKAWDDEEEARQAVYSNPTIATTDYTRTAQGSRKPQGAQGLKKFGHVQEQEETEPETIDSATQRMRRMSDIIDSESGFFRKLLRKLGL
jgi:DnaJ-class molecular chaperone